MRRTLFVFSPLNTDSLSNIATLMLDELKEALLEKLIELKYDDATCKYLAEKCEGGKRGARELRNYIRREIEAKIVDIVIDNAEGSISSVSVTVKDNNLVIDYKKL